MAERPEQPAPEDAVAGGSGEAAEPGSGRDASRSSARRWTRRLAIGLAVVVALVGLWGVVGKYLLPGLVADTIADRLAALSGRPASVERVEIQPYDLLIRIHGLRVGEPAEVGQPADGSGEPSAAEGAGLEAPRSYAQVRMVEADLSWRTFRHLAPVVDRLIVVRPDLLVARRADGSYDGADIVERLQSPEADQGSDGEPPRFSVANVQLIGGRLRLDDRKLGVTHEAARIGLGVPFASSLSEDEGTAVVPSLELLLDGAPVRADGHLLPFGEEPTGEIVLAIDALDLTRLLPHLPQPLPVELVSAELGARLTSAFVVPQSEPARVRVRGDAGLAGVELLQPDDRPLLKLAGVDALGIEFESTASRLALERLRVRAPEVAVERRKGEARFLDPVLRALEATEREASDSLEADRTDPSSQVETATAASDPDEPPALSWSIGTIEVEQGSLRFADQAFEPKPLSLALDELRASVIGLASPQPSPARIELAAVSSDGAQIEAQANARIEPLAVEGVAAVRGVPIAQWSWLAGPALKLSVRGGEADVSTRFEAGQPDDQTSPLRWKLSEGQAAVRDLRALDGDREVVRLGKLAASGLEVDPGPQRVTVESIALEAGQLQLRRDADGGFDAAGWWDSGPASADAPTRSDGAWQFAIREARVDDTEIALDYAPVSGERFAPLKLSALEFETGEWASDSTSPLAVGLKVAVGDRGRLEARGTVAPATGAAELALVARSLPMQAAQPWLPVDVNARIRAGDLSADGKLQVSTARDGALQGGWQGEVMVADLATRLKREPSGAGPAGESGSGPSARSPDGGPSGNGTRGSRFGGDLLRWKTLRLPALKIELSPFAVDVGDVALDGLQSRLVISPQGRFNLQDLFGDEASDTPADGTPAANSAVDAEAAASGGSTPDASGVVADQAAGSGQPAGPAQADPSQAAEAAPRADDGPDMLGGDPGPLPPVSPPPKADAPPVRIGTITLTDGNIDFSDFFIKPNYSANLTDLGGTIGAMSPGQPGDIALKGRIDNTGTVQVAGRIDPIGEPLFLDLRADAHDIDLPALSPYSAKYVGYGIEKGKLSASVEYRVVDGQLTAQNQIVLDQLTFGEPVESPDALDLPVLFAVSLLKDRNGVIDVQLPISGSLDDPQFSIGSIVLRLVGNLIVRAVTAPFSLIASLVGGSADELSSLPFAAGDAALGEAARDRLESLAKALTERPGLKLEIGGRITQADLDAQRRTALDARLARLKRNADGAKPRRGDAGVSMTPDERRALIEQAWVAAQAKPAARGERPSVEAMESQLLEAIDVKEGTLRELANRRAQAAKDWLAGEAGIEASRLFVTAAKLPGEEQDNAGATAGTDDVIGVELKLGG